MTITGVQIGLEVEGGTVEEYLSPRRHVIVPESLACVEWLEEGQELVPLKYEVRCEIYQVPAASTITPSLHAWDQTQIFDVTVDPSTLPAEALTIGSWECLPLAAPDFRCHEYPTHSPRFSDPALSETWTAPSLQRAKMITVELRNKWETRTDAYDSLGLFVGEVHDQDYDEGRTEQGSEARFAEVCNRITAGERPFENYRAASSWIASRLLAHTLDRLQRAAVYEACVPVISCVSTPPE